MQFHLNGFRSGDPQISEPADGYDAPQSDALPQEVDVLIVGSGPTGLTLAAQLSAFSDIRTRIVEQKSGPLLLGQADGVACRTMEMFEAFGFSERVLKEAYWVNETSFWRPDDNERANIVRSSRIQDVEDGLSEFPHVILNQARVHDFCLDVMRNSPARLQPDYSRRLLDLTIAEAKGAYPVTVRLERLDPAHAGQAEMVKAKFVVGCDGARSAVRKSLDRELRGDSASQAWGVMDVLAVTDFPDIRLKSAIQSADEGSALIIPREGGYLFRIYIELDKLTENERVSSLNITPDRLIRAAQRILHPYALDVKQVVWWSVYEIGQRLCDRFDDLGEDASPGRAPSVFIAGDACHTHSPKAGQGMNVSMQDSFNLGWKLAAVLRGRCSPAVLRSYSDERRSVAKELIDFDRKLAKMFSTPPKDPSKPDSEGVDPAEFQKYFMKQLRFTAGTETRYAPSLVCGKPMHQHLAVKADGRWRLFAFAAAEHPAATSRLHSLCAFLAGSPHSPVRRHTPKDADVDSVIDVRAVLQQGHRELAIEAMPPFLLPRKGHYGLTDYEKMFCPDLKNGPDIFDARGVDRKRGCIVVVRPDQYVAHVLPLDAYDELATFFGGFMLEA